MQFHDVRFPPSLSFGSVGGPQRQTDVVTLANGHEAARHQFHRYTMFIEHVHDMFKEIIVNFLF